MSDIKIGYDTEKAMLSGVLMYTCVQKPVQKYESEDKEFKVSVVVDEDTADIWNERHPKQEAKSVLTAKFQEIYKIEAPVPSAKKQYVITVRKDEMLANGEPVPLQYLPKVFVKGSNGKLQDVTKTKLVANGSTGTVSIEVYENKYGVFARLKNILVENLIEYQQSGGVAGSEFGEVDNAGDEFEAPQEQPKEAPKPKAAAKPKRKVEESSDDADEDPFN